MGIVAGDDINASSFAFLIGVVLPYAGSSAPTDWAFCDGSAISRTTYADLFAIIGTTFGVGDGSTTFNLPDMRGNVPLGKDNMGGSSRNRVTSANADTLGGEDGAETHTLSTSEIPAHAHGISNTVNVVSGSGAEEGLIYDDSSDTIGTAGITDTDGGSGGAHNNMQPYISLNFIIKITA